MRSATDVTLHRVERLLDDVTYENAGFAATLSRLRARVRAHHLYAKQSSKNRHFYNSPVQRFNWISAEGNGESLAHERSLEEYIRDQMAVIVRLQREINCHADASGRLVQINHSRGRLNQILRLGNKAFSRN